MSQAHTSGSQGRLRGPKGATVVGATVSGLAAIALLLLVGSETAAGASCTPSVRKVLVGNGGADGAMLVPVDGRRAATFIRTTSSGQQVTGTIVC